MNLKITITMFFGLISLFLLFLMIKEVFIGEINKHLWLKKGAKIGVLTWATSWTASLSYTAYRKANLFEPDTLIAIMLLFCVFIPVGLGMFISYLISRNSLEALGKAVRSKKG